ncbi:MAG: tRNA lysidine(34) synthetase TilS [Patescibacteria group bacterium]
MKIISHGAREQGLVSLIRTELAQAGVRSADLLVVAVSGGVDSISLLDGLRQLSHRLVVAHVNHGLRKEADKDERLVADYCHQHNLEFVVERVDLGNKTTAVEERARILRYEVLRKVAKKRQAKWIVTAHTADDQVETVIANWLRGSLVRGMGGMKLTSEGVVRPLLMVWKRELLVYAKRHKLKYATDKTNTDVKFTRNRIRHQLLPELRKFNSQLDQQLWQNSLLWQQVDQALIMLAQEHLKKIGKSTKQGMALSISKLRELTPLMQIEVVKAALGKMLVGVERSHFLEVIKILVSSKPTVAKRRLGGELFVMKSRDKITVSRG